MNLKDALIHAAQGNAILFVGSGFSRNARHGADLPELNNDDRMPTGKQLARLLCRVCGVDEDYALQDISAHYIDVHGEESLRKLLVSLFTTRHLAPEHRSFAKLPWKRVYTTNYDDVVERTFAEENSGIETLDHENDPNDLPSDQPACVHLNGSISRANLGSITRQLRLTTDSFARKGIPDLRWSSQFRHDVAAAKAIVFVGYSASDLDISRVLADTPNVQNKAVFACGTSKDPVLESTISPYGTLVADDARTVSVLIDQVLQEWVPTKHDQLSLTYVREVTPPASTKSPSLDDFLDLFAFGTLKEQHLWKEVANDQEHGIIYRSPHLSTVVSGLRRHGVAYVIHGELGTGKSVFLRHAASLFTSRGGRVFWIDEAGPGIEEEIDAVSASVEENLLFVVDNYVSMPSLIKTIGHAYRQNFSVIVAARTIPHQASIELLNEALSAFKLMEIDIGRLTDDAIEWLLTTYDQNGLWPGHVDKGTHAKRSFLDRECDRFLPGVILASIESPDLQVRIDEMTKAIRESGASAARVFAAALILPTVGHIATANTILDLFQDEYVNDVGFTRNPAVRAFLSLNGDEFRARNAIVAQYVLQKSLSVNEITDTIATMIKAADALFSNWRYAELYKTLMRVSKLQAVFSNDNFETATNQLYDKLKSLDRCRQDPQFWLQWSIARMAAGRFGDSWTKLDYAYKLGATNYNTEKLDNQKARLALTEAVKTDFEIDRAMRAFYTASNEITKQLRTASNKDYPFRVAVYYRDFVDKYHAAMTSDDIKRCRDSALGVHRVLQSLPDDLNRRRYPAECRRAIDHVLVLLQPPT